MSCILSCVFIVGSRVAKIVIAPPNIPRVITGIKPMAKNPFIIDLTPTSSYSSSSITASPIVPLVANLRTGPNVAPLSLLTLITGVSSV